MKKIVSIILSVVLILSCFSVMAFAGKTPDDAGNFDFNVSDLVSGVIDEMNFKDALENLDFNNINIPDGFDESSFATGALKDVNFLGLSIDFLYNSKDELMWPTVAIDKGDIAIAKANINTYLLRMLKSKFIGDKLYNDRYATAICNFIGHLLFVNYEDKEIHFKNNYAEKVEFYSRIADESGLSDLLSKNWCPYLTTSCNYKPLLFTLGVNFNDFPAPERDIMDGAIVARILIETVIKRTLEIGPLNYLLDVIWAFSRTYNVFMIKPIQQLFKVKVEAGVITNDELKTFKGLFNLIANDNNPNDLTKLQFFAPPLARFAVSKDSTELFLYVLIYLNMVGRYKNNSGALSTIKGKISASNIIGSEDKSRINTILDGMFLGNTADMVDLVSDLLVENVQQAGHSIWVSFREYLAGILKSFTGLFDRIYQSLKTVFEL